MTAPVLLLLVMGTMDYAWFLSHSAVLQDATDQTARLASMQISADTYDSDVISEGWEDLGEEIWQRHAYPGEPSFQTTIFQGADSSWYVQISSSVSYGSIAGWIVVPEQVVARSTRRLNDQTLAESSVAVAAAATSL